MGIHGNNLLNFEHFFIIYRLFVVELLTVLRLYLAAALTKETVKLKYLVIKKSVSIILPWTFLNLTMIKSIFYLSLLFFFV